MNFDLWPSSDPPPGFADRVMAAHEPRRHRAPFVIAAVLAASVAFGMFRFMPASGFGAPSSRASYQLGRRGVAVAEPGAALRWSISPAGTATVTQDAGDVFYRVEHGGAFHVLAAGADVAVTGTCFRVEVLDMGPTGKMLASAAVGAAASAAVLVTVYEGRVRVTSAGAARDVAAGERARVERGKAPVVSAAVTTTPPALLAEAPAGDDAKASRDELVTRAQKDRTQIAALQARVRELESERGKLLVRSSKPSPGGGDDEAEPSGLPPRNKFHGFTPDELRAMAQNCEVRVDLPPLEREPFQMRPEMGARLHLSDDQQATVTEAMNAVRVDAIAKMRALYIEATGDVQGADSLDPVTLGREILQKSRREAVEAARTKVARERAGLDAPPPNPDTGTIPERYFRYLVTIGDSLEQRLQPALGVQGASDTRDRLTPIRMNMNGCNDQR